MRCSFSILVLVACAPFARGGDVVVEDIFGRRLNEHGLVLVDWEGQIANPAMKVYVVPPASPSVCVTSSIEKEGAASSSVIVCVAFAVSMTVEPEGWLFERWTVKVSSPSYVASPFTNTVTVRVRSLGTPVKLAVPEAAT